MIAAIVVANGVLGYVQEARAEEAVAALQRMAAAHGDRASATGTRSAYRPTRWCSATSSRSAEGDAVSADGRLLQRGHAARSPSRR